MRIEWNKELYHYGMPRRSGRYKWGSGEDPYHHGADVKKAKTEYKQKRHDLRIQRLKTVANRAMHPIAKVKADWGFNGNTIGGKAAVRLVEDKAIKINNMKHEKENAKIAYKKAKIMAKHGTADMKDVDEKLQKKLGNKDIKTTKLSDFITSVQNNRDQKLAAKNERRIEKRIEKASNKKSNTKSDINIAENRAKFKAAKKTVRRTRNRVILEGMAHPLTGPASIYGISGYTKRGKRVGIKMDKNREAMYNARREKLKARYNYQNSKGHTKKIRYRG